MSVTKKPTDEDVEFAIRRALIGVKDDHVEAVMATALYYLLDEFPKVKTPIGHMHPYRDLIATHMMEHLRKVYNGV